jgi:UDP-N-acetylglucosamine 2-epimerase (hydrolysing)
MKKKIAFITGTRADYGKIKSIIFKLSKDKKFEVYIFITGMHLQKKYGYTYLHILRENKNNCKLFLSSNYCKYNAQDKTLSKTINLFSDYINKIKPDMIFVHGDRVESLAASISGSLNNFLVAHIEGGEISGTIDEHMRHAISKMSHLHFVSNRYAKKILKLLGEKDKNIFNVGSPDIDIMKSKKLPKLEQVKKKYKISFAQYSISILHPVNSRLKSLKKNCLNYFKSLVDSKKKYILIYPNNDPGGGIILDEIKKLENNKNFKIIPSMRFEYFLTLLKNAEFIIGNSSAAIREAPFYGIRGFNIGDRQKFRFTSNNIINLSFDYKSILREIIKKYSKNFSKSKLYGQGDASNKIVKILKKKNIWKTDLQKYITHKVQ